MPKDRGPNITQTAPKCYSNARWYPKAPSGGQGLAVCRLREVWPYRSDTRQTALSSDGFLDRALVAEPAEREAICIPT